MLKLAPRAKSDKFCWILCFWDSNLQQQSPVRRAEYQHKSHLSVSKSGDIEN